jgi:hypothetical protein
MKKKRKKKNAHHFIVFFQGRTFDVVGFHCFLLILFGFSQGYGTAQQQAQLTLQGGAGMVGQLGLQIHHQLRHHLGCVLLNLRIL